MEPTLSQVWAAMRCPDCPSTVAVSMSRDAGPWVRILHARTCPMIPDQTRRMFMCRLPEIYTVEIPED